ncbi:MULTISPECIES: serine hydrolase domain-containing protein [Streptosporangium]|uniref:D-alanyl-D-alanine carboxypeptidase n=1 Tax=Streptosporangium brasiliense TaxID=47480 RepID=A0ABT9REX4_9ACTN|nr:serine hydrolase domain-containing protein [Streptosporangium brasiliense]MDP9866935.1 D-alanyl-D-alanine carboxypeptidase [Streptosporangium brasiliense]
MKTQSPSAITATKARVFGVHQHPVIRGKVFRRVAVTALAAALLAGASTPGMAAADSRAVSKAAAVGQDRPELRKAIQAFVDSGLAAGMQMRVNDERGEWVGSAGVRKLGTSAKPPTGGHFRIGSTTKNFTATLALKLVDAGEVKLDAPVADYLPQYELDRRITVRMLLQHTSGLFDYSFDVGPDGKPVSLISWQGKEWVAKRFHTYTDDELVRLALSKPSKFDPGTGWSYSNTNYVLVKLLIEKVTGHSYAVEMKRRILGPLKLQHTVVPGVRSGMPAPYAHAYYRYQDAAGRWKVIDVTRQNPSWISAAGEIISTTEDLHTFFSALNDGTLISAELLAEMRRPHPNSAGLFGSYGLGLYVQDTGPKCDGIILNHNGSSNGYGALMFSTPDGKKTLTASITTGDAAVDVATEFPKALNNLVMTVFCDGQARSADAAEPAH